ncbi:unnamed protein product [Brassica rapa subsp. narinosa]
MANDLVILSDLQTGHSSSSVQVRLLRFWEARNVRRGGELMSLNHNCTGSAEYTSLRYLESSSAESSSDLERRDRNIQDLKQEQEQPSPVSFLERIRLEEETVEEKIRFLAFDDSGMNLLEKDSVHKFVKKVLEVLRLNWTNLMARCIKETSLLDEFSHEASSGS